MEKLTTSKLKVLDRYNALLALQNGLKKERAKLEEAVFTVDRRFIHYNVLLVNNGCDRNYFRRIDTFMTEIAQKESDETVENCLKIELITSAFDWLSVNPNKDYGIGIVKQSIKVRYGHSMPNFSNRGYLKSRGETLDSTGSYMSSLTLL